MSTFLADLKHVDSEALREYAGGDLGLILDNFRALDRHAARVIVRVPVIPGFNDFDEAIGGIVAFAASLSNVQEINFLPYHTLGMSKSYQIGREYRYLTCLPDWDGRLDRYTQMAEQRGLRTNIGG